MKRVVTFIALIYSIGLFAQYGNEWIDYTKPLYKISVNQEGIHRIESTTLSANGLNFIDPDNFIMYRNGVEIPIYVNQSGGNVNYIEFYGYPNDGTLDTELYADPDWQLHTYTSLFEEAASYYLTYANFGGNERIVNTNNDLTNLPPAEQFFMHTAYQTFDDTYCAGEPVYIAGGTLYNSIFDNGEGYIGSGSDQFNNTTLTKTYTLSTPNKFNAGPQATLETVVVGTTTQAHHFTVSVGNTQVSDEQFTNFQVVKTTENFNSGLVGNTTNVTFQSIPTTSGTNRNTPALVSITYPRQFQFNNASSAVFEIEGNGTRQYLTIQGINDLGTQPVLYDVTNGYRIVSADSPGATTHRFVLPAASGTRKLVLRANNSSTTIPVNSIVSVNLVNFANIANQGTYIVLSHEDLIGTPEFQDYVSYRASLAGGAHNVVVVDVAQLYHQFGFGVDRHPAAIRRFTDYVIDNWSFDAEYMFIIGKGREHREFRFNNAVRELCLVPTFGNPGSDVLLVADNSSSTPKLAIGRLAANNGVEIRTYFEKVLQYEQALNLVGDPYQTIENKDFQKQILHFGGGNNGSQQAQFQSYLNNYKNLAEDTLWGANVYSVFKTTSNPLQNIQSEFLRDKIDNGVSLITFFGHSYAGGFDVSFDEPENYTNVGKYPIYLANGCNAGIIHSGSLSVSERFIFADQKGAIAYVSTTDLSSSLSLNKYSTNVYGNFSNELYNSTIGKVLQATVNDIDVCCSNNAPDMMVAQEMTLHGDPAIPLNQYNQPDYDIEAEKVYFEPSNITTSIDSFNLVLEIYNLGRAIDETIHVEVVRNYPNGTQEVYNKEMIAPLYRDSISFTMPTTNGLSGLGLNSFSIYVDVDDVVVNELSETNNNLINEVNLVIGSDDIFPIYPYEFAIVPQQGVTLKASTGNPLASVASYTFQIDTSELFLNPLTQGVVNSVGGVVEWTVPLSMEDSTVYYWRVSKNGTNPNWQYSSFIFIANEFPGWNQSHYYQWLKDSYQNIYLDNDRVFKFEDDVKEILVQTGAVNFNEMKWVLNGAKQHNWQMNNCGGGVGYPNGFTIAVINNLTGLPTDVENTSTTSSYGPFGNIHCVGATDVKTVANFRAFGNTPADHPTPGIPWSDIILDYLNNEVPNDYYVIIYSINNPRFDLMDANLLNYLNSRGASVSNATSGPMIMAYREDGASSNALDFQVGTSFSDIVTSNFVISGTWNSGNFRSTLIGPAASWGSFHWRFNALEVPTDDEQQVLIYGVTGPSDAGTVVMNIPMSSLDTSIAQIDANQYPYLRLQLMGEDETDRTPTQPEYWRVIFEEAPELAINPAKHFVVNADTVSQGNVWHLEVAVENVSDYNMDSVWTKYSSVYGDNSLTQTYRQSRELPAFDTLHLVYEEQTLDAKFPGTNRLTIEANPLDFNHQLEQFHFNNFLQIDYEVQGDNENPLLDVTFDGIHILDGDIVSSKPEISIQLKDENQFLALDDTSLLDLYFRQIKPSAGGLERIKFSNPDVQFVPADLSSGGNNKAMVHINADFPVDGTYELVVRSADKSGNTSSGTDNRLIDLVYYDYKISFEVINRTTVSNVLNYPNPFTTQTQFVFTLTGSELPDYMEIQIMNVKGTVVRQITMDELGPIHIGLNRTQYAWDGRDEYGDLLANGVYFYKIITSLDNKEIEHYSIDQVDRFFKRGIGKMVMIR